MLFTFISLLIWISAVTVAITVHEFAHAWMANRLGDPTARIHGRLSLNPLKHYDRVGTTMLLFSATARAFGAPIIPLGWAKPVPFDPYNLENPRRDGALIALAGPVSNLLLATLISFLTRTIFMEVALLNIVSLSFIMINVSLAIFNLIPIHPLDGSKILPALLPPAMSVDYERAMRRYGMIILLFMILPTVDGSSPINALITPVILKVLGLLLP